MPTSVKPIPDNSSPLIPRLFCKDVAAEIDFCVKALGATELGHRVDEDGKIAHALLTISGAMIMIDAEFPSSPTRAPLPDGSSPVVIFVYVADVDQVIERAVARGAKILIQAQNQFWGDRLGWIMDNAGHVWTIASRVEETTDA